jgi:signal transduction histidine kinase
MDTLIKPIKVGLILIFITMITILHYGTLHGQLGQHIPHRELFFIPILLASFWYGLSFGLITSLTVSLIYAPHVFVHGELQNNLLAVSFQISVFNLVALMLGWLVERRKRQHSQLIVFEKLAVLGRAAIAVGHEMKDLLGAIKKIAIRLKSLKSKELDKDFEKEMSRLERMVKILSSFDTVGPMQLFSNDLNMIIREKLAYHRKAADKSGVNLEENLDDKGCPSQVNMETIGWVFDQIIKNALDVSSQGKSIRIRSCRKGDHCEVIIADEGPGIKPEHLPNIFKPFFTTKETGQGLALAGCRKILSDLGGDIKIDSKWGAGAAFTLVIPRNYSGKPLSVDPIETVIRGEKVERLYRE